MLLWNLNFELRESDPKKSTKNVARTINLTFVVLNEHTVCLSELRRPGGEDQALCSRGNAWTETVESAGHLIKFLFAFSCLLILTCVLNSLNCYVHLGDTMAERSEAGDLKFEFQHFEEFENINLYSKKRISLKPSCSVRTVYDFWSSSKFNISQDV